MQHPSPRAPWQLGPRGRRYFDRLLVAGLLLPVLVIAVAGTDPWWTILGFAQIVPLLWRRSRPLAAFAAVALASACQVLVIDSPIWSQLAFPVAVYSAARFGTAAGAWTALGVSVLAAAVATVDWSSSLSLTWARLLPNFLSISAIVITSWALGTVGRTREAHVATLLDRAEQAERIAEREVQLAAQDERSRIAREMHDVVAHGLSVIVVQADGARYAAAKDPDVAVRTLETIGVTGREALTEMRRLLGLLRSGDSGVRPQPGLGDLPHLLDEARAAGMDLEAKLPDPEQAASVPEGVGLAAYRIVQEALTNVRKHAGPAAAVRVSVEVGREVLLEVCDDGRGAAASPGDGHGLVGMRERAAVHGGSVQAGPAPGGGFTVRARIPR
ncbi:sensor histidine kinase [Nocardioides campestrisoli]|uniref:sensor histidine kinase n=1 Tax=Nocardioides campestrisoli TaxID=2736757 RepID=UPI0015E75425|nr:sensor histidine kinase [Nocardioides campestrisoli]